MQLVARVHLQQVIIVQFHHRLQIADVLVLTDRDLQDLKLIVGRCCIATATDAAHSASGHVAGLVLSPSL